MKRAVTEHDFRMPEFRNAKPEDYEFRDDGKIVRKDRWEAGIHRIKNIVRPFIAEFEVDEVVAAVKRLEGVRLSESLAEAKAVFETEPKAIECIAYIEQWLAVRAAPQATQSKEMEE